MDYCSAITYTAGLLLLLLAPCPCAYSDDRIVPGKPLSPGATIVSEDGSFALGFFSPTNNDSTPAKLYLGICYNDIPEFTVVWVANRETPLTPTLSLAADTSDLVLSGADGHAVWTTNVTGGGVPAGSPAASPPATGGVAAAVLLNSGDLVIRSPNGTTLWQSFEHPADTLLPGMKIRIRYRTRSGEQLVSWKGPGDPSPGSFTFGADPDRVIQLFLWQWDDGTRRRRRPVMRSAPWTGYMVGGQYQGNTTSLVYVAFVSTEEQMYLTYTLADGAPRTRYVLTYAGEYQLQSWNRSSMAWAVLGVWPPPTGTGTGTGSSCSSRYGHCGPNGYCDSTEAAVPTCRCLDGFEPASAEEWSGGTFAQGCRRKDGSPPRCGDGFLALAGMKSPDEFVRVVNRTLEECAAECSRSCSCVAYAYANLRLSSSSSTASAGDVTRCLVWAGDLIDTAKMGDAAIGSDTLYLRTPGLRAGQRSKTNALKIALPTVLTSSILLLLMGVSLAKFKFKGKTGNRKRSKKLIFGGMGSSDELGEINSAQDFVLPFVRFDDIVAATHNFSDAYEIGQGGFGKVYMGILGGQEVATKRLNKDSKQGTEELEMKLFS